MVGHQSKDKIDELIRAVAFLLLKETKENMLFGVERKESCRQLGVRDQSTRIRLSENLHIMMKSEQRNQNRSMCLCQEEWYSAHSTSLNI